THAVSHEFADDRITVGKDFVLNGGAQVAEPAAALRVGDGHIECAFGDHQQALHLVIGDAHWHRGSRIADPALPDHADIQFHDIAVLDSAVPADAVHDLFVQRNADIARETAITEKRTLAAHFRDEIR